VLAGKIVRRFGADLSGRKFALWGLAFKPDTDDMREAPSLVLIEELLRRGATVCAYDPVVKNPNDAKTAMDAVQGADALVICTEWKEFRSPDFAAIKAALREPVVFDGRNMFLPEALEAAGLEYHAIGRPTHGLNGLRRFDVPSEAASYFPPLDEAA
jgi:UDPglucose 6-dehydrogenase